MGLALDDVEHIVVRLKWDVFISGFDASMRLTTFSIDSPMYAGGLLSLGLGTKSNKI